jgi:hypothetical protein
MLAMMQRLVDHSKPPASPAFDEQLPRLRLGKALQRRNVAARIYEGAAEVRAHLRGLEQKVETV